MSLFLLAPEARRLADVLLLNRAAEPSTLQPIGGTVRARRIAAVLQIAFGAYLLGMNVHGWRRPSSAETAPRETAQASGDLFQQMLDGDDDGRHRQRRQAYKLFGTPRAARLPSRGNFYHGEFGLPVEKADGTPAPPLRQIRARRITSRPPPARR